MKHLLSLLLVLSIISSVHGQKVDLDSYAIRTAYMQLPRNPMPPEFTTYSTNFVAVGVNTDRYNISLKDLNASYFSINGFKRLTKGGHFSIRVQINAPVVSDAKEVTEEKIEKKDGKEIKILSYYKTFTVVVPARYAIEDYKLAILEEGALADGGATTTWKSQPYSTTAALATYWNREQGGIINSEISSNLSGSLRRFQARLNNEYGYVPMEEQKGEMWVLASSKHPDYKEYQAHFQTIKAALAEMTPSTGLDPEKVKPAIAYLEAIPGRYTADEKADRKMRYSAYFNLSILYYWLDDMDKSMKNAQALVDNNYDKTDLDHVINYIPTVRARFKANKLTTRHYKRDVGDAVSPVNERVIAEEAEKREQDERDRQAKSEQAMAEMNNTVQKIGTLLDRIQAAREQAQKDIVKLDADISKDPTNAKLYVTRAQKKEVINDHMGATNDYERASSLKPKDIDFLRAIGRTGLSAGAYEKALRAYDEWLVMQPKNDEAHYLRGNVLLQSTQYATAIDAYTKSIALNPKRVDAYVQRGWCEDYVGRYEEGANDMQKAAALDPKLAEPVLGLGVIRISTKRYADALAEFDRALLLDRNLYRTYGNRALALAYLGRLDEAANDVERALRVVPNYSNGLYIRSYVRVLQKNYQGAIEDARKALELRHSKPYRPYTVLGDAMLGLGIREEAVRMYDEALKINPTFSDAIEAKQRAKSVATK